MNEINDDEDGSIRMSHIGAAIIAANSEFPSSNVASSSTSIRDPIEMPVLRDEGDLPEPYTAWSPEAMLTFMPLCIQGVRAENPQQLRWNDSNCMKSDFNCFATWWMLVSLETSQLDCQQLSWPGTWQTFQAMRSLQTMAKAGSSCATPWMRLNMQWR